ncbi:hypothetical protein GSI_10461 [Ganoderma sinense ZZ0214-1]|uniref:Uncharacterized protein n=1 Tax=Ganoderma sinense ZZ0214-1 TaxID=1077348 RepID=A0A2G8S0Q3_9APHY|nr:hypothetical protein GSI_10461 [Ganoderma sinense ZZ0214-1]
MSPDGRMCAWGANSRRVGSRYPEVRTAGATGRRLEVPQFFDVVDGAVTQIKWVNHSSLAFGTAFGYLHLWTMAETQVFHSDLRCRVRGGAEITSIATRRKGSIWRIVVGTLDCHVVAFEWAGKGDFHTLFGLDSFTAIPRALSFEENGNIRVFSLHDGCLHSLDGSTGKHLDKPTWLTDVIGYATVDEKKGLALICHMDGFSMHQLPTRNIEATYLTDPSTTTKPKPIMFTENGCRVITGSDHGKVYVFKTEGGKPVDILQHATAGDMVQSITTYCNEEWSTIICATSSDDVGCPSVSFWVRRIGSKRIPSTPINYSEAGVRRKGHNDPQALSSTVVSATRELFEFLWKSVVGMLVLLFTSAVLSEAPVRAAADVSTATCKSAPIPADLFGFFLDVLIADHRHPPSSSSPLRINLRRPSSHQPSFASDLSSSLCLPSSPSSGLRLALSSTAIFSVQSSSSRARGPATLSPLPLPLDHPIARTANHLLALCRPLPLIVSSPHVILVRRAHASRPRAPLVSLLPSSFSSSSRRRGYAHAYRLPPVYAS